MFIIWLFWQCIYIFSKTCANSWRKRHHCIYKLLRHFEITECQINYFYCKRAATPLGPGIFVVSWFFNILREIYFNAKYLIYILVITYINKCFIPSEIDNFDTGLLIEVWDKGMLWDKTIGYFWEPLQKILQCAELVCKCK